MLTNGFLWVLLSGLVSGSVNWEYSGSTGPNKWSTIAQACGLSAQSPINIRTSYLYPNPNLGLPNLGNYSQPLSGGSVVNNGHTIQINLPAENKYQLSGEGIENTYTALQLHFHWTGKDSKSGGSEHTVNGNYYDAEMHIVHIQDPYTSLDDVKDMRDGLAVLGVFLKADKLAGDNVNFKALLDSVSHCRYKGDTIPLNGSFSLLSLLPDSGSYYRYYGSLTTPPCFETVLWTVYQQPVIISQKQLEIFQSLSSASSSDKENEGTNDHDSNGNTTLSDNFRPTQPLNERIVSVYYDVEITEDEDHSWGYGGDQSPSIWSENYPFCKGTRQSPIDFHPKDFMRSPTLKGLHFSPSYSQSTSGRLTNNGHTVVYTLHGDNPLHFTTVDKKYRVLQLHFHWGSAKMNDMSLSYMGGSEHTVDGKHYPIEMHIVHQKEKSDGNPDDDLAVVGIFFNIVEDSSGEVETNEAFQKIADAFENVEYQDQEVAIEDGPALENFFPNNQSYYRYLGSLTTPPCNETVLWTVFVNPVIVSKEKFLEFQALSKVKQSVVVPKNSTKQQSEAKNDGDADEKSILDKLLLLDNFRPTQPYDDREVEVYVEDDIIPTTDVLSIALYTIAGVVVFAGILAMMVCAKRKEKKEFQLVSVEEKVETHSEEVEAPFSRQEPSTGGPLLGTETTYFTSPS